VNGVGPVWPVVAVVLVAVASSITVVGNAFAGDDIPVIRDNALVHSPANIRAIFTSPYWPPPAPPDLYRPLASLFMAIQWVVGDGSAAVFRIVSSALYAGVCVGVLALSRRVARPPIALAVAVLFAAHPVHVEAVALGVNQGEMIVALCASAMVVRYVDRRRENRLERRDWIVIAFVFAAGVLVKESALIVPGLLVAADLLLVPGPIRVSRLRHVWLGYAAIALVGVLFVFVRSRVLSGNVVGSFTAEALVGLGIGRRALTMLRVVPEWLRLFVWPAHLRIDYSPGEFIASSGFGWREALGLALVVAFIGIAIATWRRAPTVAFGLTWCAISLLPVSNVLIPTGVLLAERTLFLPSVGFLIAVGGVVDSLTGRLAEARWKRGVAVAASMLAILGVGRSAARYRIWRDPQTLAVSGVRDAPKSWRVQRAYGEALFDAGRPADAIRAYAVSLQWAPEPWFVRNSLSRRLRMLGDDAGAAQQLTASLRERPGQREATAELAAAFLALGRYSDARRLADSVIVADNAPPIMVWLRRVADSASARRAPAGTIRVGVRGP
jgi:hypothetical protein